MLSNEDIKMMLEIISERNSLIYKRADQYQSMSVHREAQRKIDTVEPLRTKLKELISE